MTELQTLDDEYVGGMKAKGLSPWTVEISVAVLDQFLAWAQGQGVSKPEQLTQSLLDRWSRYLLEEHRTPKGKPLARASVRSYSRAASTWVRWAQAEGLLDSRLKTRTPREEHKVLVTLSRRQIDDL